MWPYDGNANFLFINNELVIWKIALSKSNEDVIMSMNADMLDLSKYWTTRHSPRAKIFCCVEMLDEFLESSICAMRRLILWWWADSNCRRVQSIFFRVFPNHLRLRKDFFSKLRWEFFEKEIKNKFYIDYFGLFHIWCMGWVNKEERFFYGQRNYFTENIIFSR